MKTNLVIKPIDKKIKKEREHLSNKGTLDQSYFNLRLLDNHQFFCTHTLIRFQAEVISSSRKVCGGKLQIILSRGFNSGWDNPDNFTCHIKNLEVYVFSGQNLISDSC